MKTNSPRAFLEECALSVENFPEKIEEQGFLRTATLSHMKKIFTGLTVQCLLREIDEYVKAERAKPTMTYRKSPCVPVEEVQEMQEIFEELGEGCNTSQTVTLSERVIKTIDRILSSLDCDENCPDCRFEN